MKYLVTGGLGVVGYNLVTRLLQDRDTELVRIIDNGMQPRHHYTAAKLRELDPQSQRLSIDRSRPLERVLFRFQNDADLIIHAAAHTGIPHSAEDPLEDWSSNVEGTRVLLEAMRTGVLTPKHGMVALSSVKPYSTERVPETGIDETFPMSPDEPYAASKLAQSALCQAYGRTYDLPIVTLRCSNLYGPGLCHGPRHGWLTWFCIQAALGWPIEIQGDGNQRRDMLHTSDLINAILTIGERTQDFAGEVFNIGGGPDNVVSVNHAFEFLEGFCGGLTKTHSEGRKNEDRIFYTDTTKLASVIGWEPLMNVPTGMSDVVTWAQNNSAALAEVYKQFAPKADQSCERDSGGEEEKTRRRIDDLEERLKVLEAINGIGVGND